MLKRPLHRIHADLIEDHLLLFRKDGQRKISALIDWTGAEIGIVEYERVTYRESALCKVMIKAA